MAKVKIQGNASGTGVITLIAPNTNTDRTVTLPDESITLAGAVDTQTTAKAWVNFNGSGTVSIRDSYNISSITDVKVGGFTLNFSVAMASSDYVVAGSVKNECQANGVGVVHFPSCTAASSSAAPLIIMFANAVGGTNTYTDATDISAIVFGD
jgi:hypothetical protein